MPTLYSAIPILPTIVTVVSLLTTTEMLCLSLFCSSKARDLENSLVTKESLGDEILVYLMALLCTYGLFSCPANTISVMPIWLCYSFFVLVVVWKCRLIWLEVIMMQGITSSLGFQWRSLPQCFHGVSLSSVDLWKGSFRMLEKLFVGLLIIFSKPPPSLILFMFRFFFPASPLSILLYVFIFLRWAIHL